MLLVEDLGRTVPNFLSRPMFRLDHFLYLWFWGPLNPKGRFDGTALATLMANKCFWDIPKHKKKNIRLNNLALQLPLPRWMTQGWNGSRHVVTGRSRIFFSASLPPVASLPLPAVLPTMLLPLPTWGGRQSTPSITFKLDSPSMAKKWASNSPIVMRLNSYIPPWGRPLQKCFCTLLFVW